jgi:hypothetical protein
MSFEIYPDEELSIFIKLDKERFLKEIRESILSHFKSTDEFLIYLANSTPKDCEMIISAWRTKRPKTKTGRPRKNREGISKRYDEFKVEVERRWGISFKSMPKFLEWLVDKHYPKKSTEERDAHVKTLKNLISKDRNRSSPLKSKSKRGSPAKK